MPPPLGLPLVPAPVLLSASMVPLALVPASVALPLPLPAPAGAVQVAAAGAAVACGGVSSTLLVSSVPQSKGWLWMERPPAAAPGAPAPTPPAASSSASAGPAGAAAVRSAPPPLVSAVAVAAATARRGLFAPQRPQEQGADAVAEGEDDREARLALLSAPTQLLPRSTKLLLALGAASAACVALAVAPVEVVALPGGVEAGLAAAVLLPGRLRLRRRNPRLRPLRIQLRSGVRHSHLLLAAPLLLSPLPAGAASLPSPPLMRAAAAPSPFCICGCRWCCWCCCWEWCVRSR